MSESRLRALIDAALTEPGGAGPLNVELRALRGQGEVELALALAGFLETPGALLLYDEHGHSCHDEALATLQSFPAPLAAMVPTATLARVRGRRLSDLELLALTRARAQAATLLSAGAVSALGLSAWYVVTEHRAPGLLAAVALACTLSVAGLAALLKSLPLPRAHRLPFGLLVGGALVSFLAALQAHPDPLGAALLTALGAAGLSLVVLSSWRDPIET